MFHHIEVNIQRYIVRLKDWVIQKYFTIYFPFVQYAVSNHLGVHKRNKTFIASELSYSINFVASKRKEATTASQPRDDFMLAKRFLTPVENFFQNEVRIPASSSSFLLEESNVIFHQLFPFLPPGLPYPAPFTNMKWYNWK